MKYEITNIVHPADPKLRRIRALLDIELHGVKVGDLGGFVEFEGNLSQEGDCWIGRKATVSGNAKVTGDAQVCGDASVYGNALVSGTAVVMGTAILSDRVCVSGSVRLDSGKYTGAFEYRFSSPSTGPIGIAFEGDVIAFHATSMTDRDLLRLLQIPDSRVNSRHMDGRVTVLSSDAVTVLRRPGNPLHACLSQ